MNDDQPKPSTGLDDIKLDMSNENPKGEVHKLGDVGDFKSGNIINPAIEFPSKALGGDELM